MKQLDTNNDNPMIDTDNLNIFEIISYIWKSKYLIILVSLSCSLLFYLSEINKDNTFNSSVLFEIGSIEVINFDNVLENESQKHLVENIDEIKSQFNLDFNLKNQINLTANVNFKQLESSIIEITTSSLSNENNITSLNKITSYFLDRHKSLIDIELSKHKLMLTNEINYLNDEIQFISNENKNEKNTNLSREILNLSYIKKHIEELKKIIENESLNLKILQTNAESRKKAALRNPTLNEVIYKYKTELIELEDRKLKTELRISSIENQGEKLDIFRLLQNKNKLIAKLERINNQKPKYSKLIGEIQSHSHKNFSKKKIIIGFLFGIVLSIFVIIFRDLTKFRLHRNK